MRILYCSITTMTVRFRSLRAKHIHHGDSLQFVRLSGNDWNTIKPYSDSDDARSIVWRKSTTQENIYSKEYQDNSGFSIRLIIGWALWDEFYCERFPISRSRYYTMLQSVIEQSARFWWHQYIQVDPQELSKTKPKNSLVIIAGNTLDTSLYRQIKVIAPHNDILFLHVFHPVEITGPSDMLFYGKTLDISYQQEQEQEQRRIQILITRIWGSYLKIGTDEDIEHSLNYFFSTRFQHG